MAKTLSQLRTLVRQKADIENDGKHTSDSEIDGYVNQSIEMMHSLLVDGTDGTLFAKNATILPQIGDNCYQLPDDFSQLVSVDILVGSDAVVSTQADPQAFATLTRRPNRTYRSTQHLLRWNIEQARAELFIFPAPSPANLAVQYIAEPPVLSADSDTLNFPTFWYQWVVLDAAIACANKENSDPTALMTERQKVEARLRDHIRSMTPTRVKSIRKTGWQNNRLIPPDINGGG